MRKTNRVIYTLVLGLAALAFAGCQSSAVSSRRVEFDPPALTLDVGQSAGIIATLYDFPEGDHQWLTKNSKVATVKDGVVTAVGEGTTSICLVIDGHVALCEVTVVSR